MPILKNYIEGTQLNQLRYSSYNSGRGPIIQKKIPTGISERGNEFTQAGKRADDLARIAALMTRPEGLRYLSNEKGLSQVRIKGQAQSQGKQTLLGRLVGGTLNTVKVLGSTLLQVPVNGTGLHFVKGFGERAGYLGKSYAGIVKEGGSVGSSTVDNRDLGRRIGSQYPRVKNQETISDLSSNDGNQFIKYKAGRTVSTAKRDSFIPDVDAFGNEFDNNGPINPEEKPGAQDPERLENRIGLGHIGNKTKEERKNPYEKKVDITKIDKKNYLDPTRKKGIQGVDSDGNPGDARDIVKFRFEIVDAGDVANDVDNVNLYFRAFVETFNDNYNSSWNEFQYLGRGEKFFNYLGFDRNISINFKSAVMTRHELAPMYRKLNYLASSLAPTYGNNGFMRGTLVKFTLGSYFYELPGFISSLDYTWNTTYPFEIAMKSPEVVSGVRIDDSDVQELPMVLDVQLNFRPIHRFTPQTGLYHYTTNPFTFEGQDPFFESGQTIPPLAKSVNSITNIGTTGLGPTADLSGLNNL